MVLGVPGWIHTDYSSTATHQNRTSKAYYFDFTYEINEAWRISAGIRETEDEKQFVRETGTLGNNSLGRPNNNISTGGFTRDNDVPLFNTDWLSCDLRTICVDNKDDWRKQHIDLLLIIQ